MSPDAIVTELGVDDTVGPGAATAARLLEIHEEDRMVHGVASSYDARCLDKPAVQSAVASATRELRARYALAWKTRFPNLTVVDWNLASTAISIHGLDPGSDVHLSPPGQTAWTNLVLNVLDAKFPA